VERRPPLADLDDLIERGLDELGLETTALQRGQLARLARLLESWAQRMNLTGHRSAEAVVRRLILDAAALLGVLPRFTSLADLGAGAGFPGLPLAILAPEARVVLVEARLRRHHFQRAAVRELGLPLVLPRRGRIEEIAPEPAEIVVAQAVARPAEVLRWMRPWCQPAGLIAIPGGEVAPDPFDGCSRTPEDLTVQVLGYRVPLGGPRRSVWTARLRTTAPAR
jgi:16S rRNA (guanine527-N7)-methyltransferase